MRSSSKVRVVPGRCFPDFEIFAEMFPQVTGREFIRNHEVIYGPFDKFVAQKKAELLKEHKQKEKEFQARVKATHTPKKDK